MLKCVLHENIEQFSFSRTSLTFVETRAWPQSFWHRREYIICYYFEYNEDQSDMQGLKCWKSIFEKENTWMRQDGSITYSAVLSNTSSFYSLEHAKTHNIHICFHIPWWVWYPSDSSSLLSSLTGGFTNYLCFSLWGRQYCVIKCTVSQTAWIRKKNLLLQDSVALYTEQTSLLACGVLRRDPGKIKTDSCRMNMNIKIGARRSLLQMEYRDMPLTFCCWTCLPPWIGKQQRQRSAALFSYPTGSLL